MSCDTAKEVRDINRVLFRGTASEVRDIDRVVFRATASEVITGGAAPQNAARPGERSPAISDPNLQPPPISISLPHEDGPP